MNHTRYYLHLVAILVGMQLAIPIVHAQLPNPGGNQGAGNSGEGLLDGFDFIQTLSESAGLSTTEPDAFITDAINVALGLIGLIALAVLIYGGFLFITSSGDEDKAAHAKRLILYAIVGLLLIGASVIIVNLVIDLFSP